MKKGVIYKTLREIPAFDCQDDDCRIPEGSTLEARGFDRVADTATGELFRIPRMQASNAAWYFSSGFNFKQPDVALCDLVFEVVRCNEGLQVDLLHALALDACPRAAPSYNSFTAALSADKRIEMRDPTGSVVKGTGHGKRFCTYHLKHGGQPMLNCR
jgi:hypothetical protein